MSNKEKLAEQQADDMHLLRSFMQFLNDYIQIPKGLEESYGNYAMNIDAVIDRLKSTTIYAEQERWISVDERNPEFGVPVFVYCSIYGRYIATYEHVGDFEGKSYGNWHWHDGKELGVLPPTHWMPLPSPPTVI